MASPTPRAGLLDAEILEQERTAERILKRPQLPGHTLIEERQEPYGITKITGNSNYSILTSLLSRRIPTADIAKKDIDIAATLQRASPQNVECILKRRILPVELRGYEWDSTHSKRLRRSLNSNVRPYMDVLSVCTEPMSLDMLRIKASETMEFKEKSDHFKDIYMYVEKKPKKRKGESAGISSAFMRMYREGKKYSVGVMVKAVSENRRMEGDAADKITDELISQLTSRIGAEGGEITGALRSFMREYNVKARETLNATVGFGVVVGDSSGMHVIATKDMSFYKIEGGRIASVFRPSAKNIGEDVQIVKGKGRMMYLDMGAGAGPDENHIMEDTLIALNSSIPLSDMELKRRFRASDLESVGKAIVREIKSTRMFDDLGMMVFSK
jgi:hypothetical protein